MDSDVQLYMHVGHSIQGEPKGRGQLATSGGIPAILGHPVL